MRRLKSHGGALLLLVALGVVVWLLLSAQTGSATLDSGERATSLHEPDLLKGEAKQVGLVIPQRGDSALDATDGRSIQHGPVEVLVTNGAGEPLDGVVVFAANGDPETPARDAPPTDALGRTRFLDLPYDGTWQVQVRDAEVALSGRGAEVHLAAHRLIVYNDPFEVLEEEPRIAVTGPRVALQLHVLPLSVRAEASDSGRALRGLACMVSPSAGRAGWRTGGGAPLYLCVRPGRYRTISLALLRPPDGYAVHDRLRESMLISPEAEAVHVVLPVRPHAQLFVRPPASGRWQYSVVFDGARVPGAVVRSDAFGRERVEGVPFVPGAVVHVLAQNEGQQARGQLSLAGRNTPQFVELSLLDGKPPKADASSEWFSLRRFTGRGLGRFDQRLLLWGTNGSVSRVEVHVQRPDGRPAAGARLRLPGFDKIADENGRAVFEQVAAGKHELRIWGAGPAWCHPFEVVPGPEQVLRLRAPLPATIALEVVDEEGTPTPHARIVVKQFEDMPWLDIVDGKQRIDPYTNADGRRVLHNVQPDRPVSVFATVGSLHGTAKATVPAGTSRSVRVVVKRPKDKTESSK